MKSLFLFLLSLTLLWCWGCSTSQTSDSESSLSDSTFVVNFYKSINGLSLEDVEDLIKNDLQHLDSTYFVEYDSPINGYTVKAVLKDFKPIGLSLHTGYAYMWFTDSISTRSLLHPTFALTDSIAVQLKTRIVNNLDYEITCDDYYKSKLGQFSDVPFAFFDVDFDGEKELLLRHPFVGQRGRSTYSPFKPSPSDLYSFEDDYPYSPIDSLLIESEKYVHYPILDDMAQFDRANRTIILHESAGAWGNSWLYYMLKNEECKLVKKIVEYIDWGEYKVKRIEYNGDKQTVSNIPVDENGSYSID